MQNEKLLEQAKQAAVRMQCDGGELVRKAYLWFYGEKARGVADQAEHASKRYAKKGTLCARAEKAVDTFINHTLGWTPVLST